MLISRQVGTVSSLITVFLPDRTVSTGAGLANVVASTVRMTWLRSDQAAVSSWTLTTGTLGTWTASTMTQVGSTSTLGAYQFSLPNGLFASGDNAYVHIMSSTAAFAEVPIVIELTKTDNQTYLSSQTVGFVRNNVSVSTVTIPLGVSSISTPVTASSVTAAVNVSSIYGSAAVTSAAGVWGPLSVSSITTPVTASTAGVTSISIPVGVSTGSVRVTSASIPFGVSSISTPVTASSARVTSMSVEALGNFFDTGVLLFSTAVVSSVAFEIATNATVGGNVGVSAVTIPIGVSSIATPVAVSAVTIPVGVSTGSIEISSATAAVYEAAADALLKRNVSSGANTGRTVREALYAIRNRVDLTNGVVYETDDTTSSWAFTTSTAPVDPIVEINPA